MNAKWTSEDVPGQQGRLAVVTGANTGLGFETARVLAARGASVVLAVRDTDKGKAAPARIAGTAPRATLTSHPPAPPSLAPTPTPTPCRGPAHPGLWQPRADRQLARGLRRSRPADQPEAGDGRAARAARRDRPRRARRPVLRPGPIARGQGLPGTGPFQRAIPRHGHRAPPVDSLRRADRGHLPGLTRPTRDDGAHR